MPLKFTGYRDGDWRVTSWSESADMHLHGNPNPNPPVPPRDAPGYIGPPQKTITIMGNTYPKPPQPVFLPNSMIKTEQLERGEAYIYEGEAYLNGTGPLWAAPKERDWKVYPAFGIGVSVLIIFIWLVFIHGPAIWSWLSSNGGVIFILVFAFLFGFFYLGSILRVRRI